MRGSTSWQSTSGAAAASGRSLLLLECGSFDALHSIVADSPRFKLRKVRDVFNCPYPGQPFGEGGVLHRIGTDHGTKEWSNPHTDGKVVAAMSTAQGGTSERYWRNKTCYKFVGRSDDGYCVTKNQPNSWMSVDLGEGRAVVPTHYCLRMSQANAASRVLRNWTLEGKTALPGASWEQIRKHDNDETMAPLGYSLGAWAIEEEERAFRHLRIRQHGTNGASPNWPSWGRSLAKPSRRLVLIE